MIGLGEIMLDAILAADAIEDVSEPFGCGTLPVLGEIGEGHAIVGEHDVALARSRSGSRTERGMRITGAVDPTMLRAAVALLSGERRR
jgi:hypothetical protein